MSAIRLKNVSFSYGEKAIFDDLSLDIRAGQFTALLGPNGAGKSTLFNLMIGLLDPRAGCIERLGESSLTLALKRKIGVVFQQSSLDGELTAVQNLRYFAGLYGLRVSKYDIEAHLESYALAHVMNRQVYHLSGGQRRRVELARALLQKPEILIMDEPTAGLDQASKEMITHNAHMLAKNGMTLIWITHLLDEIEQDDQAIVLRAGQVEAIGKLSDLGGVKALKSRFASDQRVTL